MPEHTPCELTPSCIMLIVLNYSAAGAPLASVSRKGQPPKQTPSTPPQLLSKRRGTELQAPHVRQAPRRGGLPLDSLKEFLEGAIPCAIQDASDDSASDDKGFEEIAPPQLSIHQTSCKLYELSYPYDEFDAATGCFVKVPKPFGFRYRTEVTPSK